MITIAVDSDFEFSSEINTGIAASVGFFDGVHKGHRFLIEQLKEIAEKHHLPSAVITFPVHPRKVLNAEYQPELLNSFEEKLYHLSTTGIDYCFVPEFTKALSELTAKEFIQNKLVRNFGVEALMIGYDHRLGKGRTDEFEHYKAYGDECGIKVFQAEPLTENNIRISSTTIRNLLTKGDVEWAASMLTYRYALEGIVIDGNKLGREMGFPTANIKLLEANKVIPQDGIYATWVYFGNKRYKGMSYIGKRPSLFAEGEQRIETHILDFEGDLYDERLKLEFVEYMRDDIKFEFIEDLNKQLVQDKKTTQNILKD